MTPDVDPIGRDEACRILDRLRANVVKPMPKAARQPSPRERDCHRALGMVMQAIAETTERCQALEEQTAMSEHEARS